MKKKRISTFIVMLAVSLMVCCIPAIADGTYSWRQEAYRSKLDVVYYGYANWLDKGVTPNSVCFFAKLYGNDKSTITTYNFAYLSIKSHTFKKMIYSGRIYYDHEICTTQKKTTAASIDVYWSFDGYEGRKYLN